MWRVGTLGDTDIQCAVECEAVVMRVSTAITEAMVLSWKVVYCLHQDWESVTAPREGVHVVSLGLGFKGRM